MPTVAPTSSGDPRTYAIIGAALDAFHELGPGFLESAYVDALVVEFGARAVPWQREVPSPIHYKNGVLPTRYRIDLLCYGQVIVEVKAASDIHPAHRAQILHYLRATGVATGLLINFGGPRLEWERFVETRQQSRWEAAMVAGLPPSGEKIEFPSPPAP